ncbi:MAG: endolytic transglycosylase MltG [Fimbriimonas sp.]
MKRKFRRLKQVLGVATLGLIGLGVYVFRELAPMPTNSAKPYVRVTRSIDLREYLQSLERRGIVRNANVSWVCLRILRLGPTVPSGTYRISPGITLEQLRFAFRNPVQQMVRLPETNWARRNANLLEKAGVCTAHEYMEAVRNPKKFQSLVPFLLPEDSLEGYLLPDTYDFPPMLGADAVVSRQLRAFVRKAYEPTIAKSGAKDISKLLTVASLVELEVARDDERPKVAGVIENRLKKKMRLQIDATINYALQKWRPLAVSEYSSVVSPYNTYRIDGLPPGPICSPSLKSIQGALSPAKHDYLYYVAMPEGYHLFAATYPEHLKNVARRRAAMGTARP